MIRPILCVCMFTALFSAVAFSDDRPRLIVTTDIGGDPDDQQSMIRLMLYSNEFDIEGLIASAAGTPGELKEHAMKPELIEQIIAAYEQVRSNLSLHALRYPQAAALRAVIKRGNAMRGVAHVGEEHDTEASRWVISVVDREDARPLNISIWGGSTDLAQALWRVRHDRTPEEVERFISKLRVHAIAHQDDTGPWINENFPDLFYVLSKAPEGRDKRESVFRGMYLGGDESLTSQEWVNEHVREGHGPLGALYPAKTWTAPNPGSALKEGDTPSWFYFLPHGVNDPEHPDWGGWGGRFRHERGGLWVDAVDTVDQPTPRNDATGARATVWRWRPAFQADFQARLDWCVVPRDHCNHAPNAAIGSDDGVSIVRRTASPGERVALSASGSRDPEGHALTYRWFTYPEAGTYRGDVRLHSDGPRTAVEVPRDASGTDIHVILEVTDDGVPRLSSFRRVIVSVK